MADLIIREPLASRIREIARQMNREPEEMIEFLLNDYLSTQPLHINLTAKGKTLETDADESKTQV